MAALGRDLAWCDECGRWGRSFAAERTFAGCGEEEAAVDEVYVCLSCLKEAKLRGATIELVWALEK